MSRSQFPSSAGICGVFSAVCFPMSELSSLLLNVGVLFVGYRSSGYFPCGVMFCACSGVRDEFWFGCPLPPRPRVV